MVTRAGHHRAHMCVKVGGGAWSIGPWSACGGCASRAPMTRRHVVATGGFQRGGVPADGHPSRGATHRASHEHGLHRHMEIDEHGWLQENARDTPTPPTQPLIGPRENRRHSLGVGRVSTGLSYSSAYDKPEKVCGRTVTMVTVRPQQMLMNTRAKRRTAASRQSVLYAWVRPPDCRRRSNTRRCPGGASRGATPRLRSVGVGIGIMYVMVATSLKISSVSVLRSLSLLPTARTLEHVLARVHVGDHLGAVAGKPYPSPIVHGVLIPLVAIVCVPPDVIHVSATPPGTIEALKFIGVIGTPCVYVSAAPASAIPLRPSHRCHTVRDSRWSPLLLLVIAGGFW